MNKEEDGEERQEVRGWRLEARGERAKGKGRRGEGRWEWAVFFAPLLQQISLMDDVLLPKLRNSSNFLD